MLGNYFKLIGAWASVFLLFWIFFKDGIYIALRASFALFFLFVLPGFSLLYKKTFLERVFLGFMVGLALVGIPSYYLGLLGFHVQYHFVLAIIITAIGIGLEKMKKEDGNESSARIP